MLLDNGRTGGYAFRLLRTDYGAEFGRIIWYYKLKALFCLFPLRFKVRESRHAMEQWISTVYVKINRALYYHKISALTIGGASSPGCGDRFVGNGRRCHSLTNRRASLESLKDIVYLAGPRYLDRDRL